MCALGKACATQDKAVCSCNPFKTRWKAEAFVCLGHVKEAVSRCADPWSRDLPRHFRGWYLGWERRVFLLCQSGDNSQCGLFISQVISQGNTNSV